MPDSSSSLVDAGGKRRRDAGRRRRGECSATEAHSGEQARSALTAALPVVTKGERERDRERERERERETLFNNVHNEGS